MMQSDLHNLKSGVQGPPPLQESSEVMERLVRMLSGEENKAGSAALHTRRWLSLSGCGCSGRYVPDAGGDKPGSRSSFEKEPSPAPLFPISGDPISPICQKSNSFFE